MSIRRQGGSPRANSHLVTFHQHAVYRVGDERLMVMPGTRLIGRLIDGLPPALRLDGMTIAINPQLVEIAPNPDPTLTQRVLAQQTEQAAGEALVALDFAQASQVFLQAAVQYRLLGDEALAEAMHAAAQRAHNASLRTPEGRADFDTYTGSMSDEALRQLGATIRLAVRQLGGYQYSPATPAEAMAAWEVVRHALSQVANLDRWERDRSRPVGPITPETLWVNAENLAGDLLAEPQGTPERRTALAELALALDPDDADGYTLLGGMAAEANDLTTARRWYTAGVQAGERKLGEAFFSAPDRPRFWLAVETRPYMRARAALADTLYQLGEAEQAVAEYWGLLDLNPGDNQGLRYILASLLLERQDHAGVERLYRFIAMPLEEDEDEEHGERAPAPPANPLDPTALSIHESAYWLYPAALYHFQREGDSERARAALKLARTQNTHVAPLLLGRTVMPYENPAHYSHGGFDEAVLYVRTGRAAWLKTPGAIDWLRGKPTAKPAPKPRAAAAPPRPNPPQVLNDTSLYDLLGEWLIDRTTYQTTQTKKVYRATITRLLEWLEAQGLPPTGDALTAAQQISTFLDTVEQQRRGAARNSIRVWCDWLVRRRVIAENPLH